MSHPPEDPILITPSGSRIYYTGPHLSSGRLPAVIYFALSASLSLYEDPFNQPISILSENSIRIFSWDLPFHGPGLDHREAILKWAQEFAQNPSSFLHFIDTSIKNIDFLVEQGLIDATHLAIAGLSRGVFVATHLAAKDTRLSTILGFAPMTHIRAIEEFAPIAPLYESISLSRLTDQLIHKRLRFYIGNHDMRVGTDSCFEFIQTLVHTAFANGIRSPQVELILYPSIGYKGHGTPPEIFQEGAHWLKTQILK